MKSVKSLLFVLVFSMVLLAGCTKTTPTEETPAVDNGGGAMIQEETPAMEAGETPAMMENDAQ